MPRYGTYSYIVLFLAIESTASDSLQSVNLQWLVWYFVKPDLIDCLFRAQPLNFSPRFNARRPCRSLSHTSSMKMLAQLHVHWHVQERHFFAAVAPSGAPWHSIRATHANGRGGRGGYKPCCVEFLVPLSIISLEFLNLSLIFSSNA